MPLARAETGASRRQWSFITAQRAAAGNRQNISGVTDFSPVWRYSSAPRKKDRYQADKADDR
jgi:hypothetical protein